MPRSEFDLISRYFNRKSFIREDVELGIGDDCALLSTEKKRRIAVSTDTLVSGVHFLSDIDPADLAYKAFMINLSDLAAMGAEPAWLSLALTLPRIDEPWLQTFSDMLFEQLEAYRMQLIGGDTTRGPLSLTLTIQGLLIEKGGLTRSGAKKGDGIYVTGTLGDSAAGLAILKNTVTISDEADKRFLIERHLRPQARIFQGKALNGLAHSAIDISDGFISDLQHILNASQCGAHIELSQLPYSPALKTYSNHEQALRWALSGGEDYELCFTLSPQYSHILENLFQRCRGPKVFYTKVGEVVSDFSEKIIFFRDGEPVSMKISNITGYDHFDTYRRE
ncbi:thiamine-phosphate kinase [Candidatus Williamhamiltonella defendens]|uniref:Thiamine-monophosphate kinase n=1 Tax=Candidatus Williamhamiltonella defendens TaxID=138072 RepID=A0A2D3TA22_9ENTR|nr:thiamine-phosphate kinase [Candidatus Hamiltonella defensa]ATW30641.1 thiamine-phosphate kinase [Candidatus Hamiltonella defensa]ATW32638.1 thiamine-phosphate kinase [Candidatus Hamiltonella defensa]